MNADFGNTEMYYALNNTKLLGQITLIGYDKVVKSKVQLSLHQCSVMCFA